MTPETHPLYNEPSWYNRIFRERTHDVEYYMHLSEFAPVGPVLELGVGSGRVALPLCRQGREVDGVDLSQSMLESCKEQLEFESPEVRARLQLHHADGASFRGSRPYALVTAPFNGIAHQHSSETLVRFLRNGYEQLLEGGSLAFDFIKPDPQRLKGGAVDIPWLEDPLTGLPSRCTERVHYDATTRIFEVETEIRPMKGDEAPRTLTLQLRQWYPEEIEQALLSIDPEMSFEASDLGDSVAYRTRSSRASRPTKR